MIALTPNETDKLLKRFHGFHDAQYQGIELIPPTAANEKFSCRIALLAQDHSSGLINKVVFHINGLGEFQIRYNEKYDYPNVRDDIAIKTYDGKVYFDLGFAATEPQSAEDIRRSDIYFVGSCVAVDECVVKGK